MANENLTEERDEASEAPYASEKKCGAGVCEGYGENPELMCPAEVSVYIAKRVGDLLDRKPEPCGAIIDKETTDRLGCLMRSDLTDLTLLIAKEARECTRPKDGRIENLSKASDVVEQMDFVIRVHQEVYSNPAP
jgi:hypothetical protein